MTNPQPPNYVAPRHSLIDALLCDPFLGSAVSLNFLKRDNRGQKLNLTHYLFLPSLVPLIVRPACGAAFGALHPPLRHSCFGWHLR